MARPKLSKREQYGRKIAKACAKKPLTPTELCAKTGFVWGGQEYHYGLSWVKEQRSKATTPFLWVRDGRVGTWGFRSNYLEGKQNILWHLANLRTRTETTTLTMEHISESAVVAMPPKARREWNRVVVLQNAVNTMLDQVISDMAPL